MNKYLKSITSENTDLITQKMSSILYYNWDPIGISNFPETRSQYDRYIEEILKIVMNDNKDELSEYLNHVRIENMSCNPNMIKDSEIADLLISSYKDEVKKIDIK